MNDLININIQVPKGKKRRQGPLVKICISQGTSQKRKKHLQHLKDILKQNNDDSIQIKEKKRIKVTHQNPLKKMFPDPPDLEENKSQMKPLIDEEKDEVLDFSFN